MNNLFVEDSQHQLPAMAQEDQFYPPERERERVVINKTGTQKIGLRMSKFFSLREGHIH